MSVKDRENEIVEMVERISSSMEDMASIRNKLEELHMKAEAKTLDTITGKMYNLIWRLKDKM